MRPRRRRLRRSPIEGHFLETISGREGRNSFGEEGRRRMSGLARRMQSGHVARVGTMLCLYHRTNNTARSLAASGADVATTGIAHG